MSYPQLLTPEEKLADAKKLLSLPRIVVICGSTRFMTEMNEADLRETKAGKIVVKPGCDMKSPHELWSDPGLCCAIPGSGSEPVGELFEAAAAGVVLIVAGPVRVESDHVECGGGEGVLEADFR